MSTAARACPTTSTVLARLSALAPNGLYTQMEKRLPGADVAGFVAGDVDKSERYGDKSEMADEEVCERAARAPVTCVRWFCWMVAHSWLHTWRHGQATCILALSLISRLRARGVIHNHACNIPIRTYKDPAPTCSCTHRTPTSTPASSMTPKRRVFATIQHPWLAALSEC